MTRSASALYWLRSVPLAAGSASFGGSPARTGVPSGDAGNPKDVTWPQNGVTLFWTLPGMKHAVLGLLLVQRQWLPSIRVLHGGAWLGHDERLVDRRVRLRRGVVVLLVGAVRQSELDDRRGDPVAQCRGRVADGGE